MLKGGTAVTVCHQYGLHCSRGLFIGLLHIDIDRLHRERRTRGRRPTDLVGGWPSARDKRCALDRRRVSWRRSCSPTSRGAGDHSAPMPRRRHGRAGRQSTCSFGEYAFLEDSRYTSQMKNVSCRTRRGWSVWAVEPRCHPPAVRKPARASKINICSSRKILPRAETGQARSDCLLGRNFLRRKRCEHLQ